MSRYQQFRAVHAAIERLCTARPCKKDGEFDRRGGIILHTQGSGKSLTMVFRGPENAVGAGASEVQDGHGHRPQDLQRQLAETAGLTGETVKVGKSIPKVKKLLASRVRSPSSRCQVRRLRSRKTRARRGSSGDLGLLQ